ncbi:MAG: PAS domain S-box protein [bacterium]|nr:PAS domain S-box protein [bacterium]
MADSPDANLPPSKFSSKQTQQLEVLRIAADIAPFIEFWVDKSGLLVYVNRYVEQILQLNREQIIGRYFWEIDDYYDHDKWKTIWIQLKHHNHTVFENKITIDEKNVGVYETHATLVNDGETAIAVCISFDITKRKATEIALRDSEARHRLLIENSADPIFIHADGVICYANPATATAIGVDDSIELIGMNTLDIIHPHDRPFIEKLLLLHQRVQLPDNKAEFRLLHRNGSSSYYEMACSSIFIDDEPAVQVTTRDINDRKKASELLQSSHNRLIALYQLSQKSHLGEQELIEYAINAAIRLTGSTVGYINFVEAVNTTLGVFTWSNGALERRDASENQKSFSSDVARIWGDCARTKKPVIHNDFVDELANQRQSDGQVALKRHLSVPVVEGNRVVIVTGVGNKEEPYDDSDVLQMQLFADGLWKLLVQKRISDKLLKSEENYRLLFHSMKNAFTLNEIILDDEGIPNDFRIIEANAAFASMYHVMVDQVIERTYRELNPTIDLEWIAVCGEVALTGIPRNLEWSSLRTQSNFDFYIYSPSPGRFAVISSDITERKRAETEKQCLTEQLQHAQKLEAIGQLAGGVAHDFNNLLMPILGYSEILQMSMPKDSPLQSEVQEIFRAAERARDLTRQLLAFSRRQTLEMKDIRLNDVIRNFEKILRRTVRENIRLTIAVPETPYTVRGDTGQIEQILMNLVVNAKDALPDGGTITITLYLQSFSEKEVTNQTAKPGDYAVVAVTDNGTGIAPELQKKIFEPFFTTKAKGQGTGLGLSTVFGIVEQHLGFIQLISEPNKGTSFRICLPLLPTESEVDQVSGDQPIIKGGTETILLVEDEQVVRDMTERLLRILGYKVISTDSPETCLSHPEIYSRHIDLMVTDVIMPMMNGKQLYDYIKSFRPTMKVLYMSGYTSEILEFDEEIVNGANFLPKPFNLETLATKVREVLRNS